LVQSLQIWFSFGGLSVHSIEDIDSKVLSNKCLAQATGTAHGSLCHPMTGRLYLNIFTQPSTDLGDPQITISTDRSTNLGDPQITISTGSSTDLGEPQITINADGSVMLSTRTLRGLGVIPEDRPQAKVEAVRPRIRPHKQSLEEWDDVARPRNNDDKMTVTPEFIQEAYIGQMSPSMELKNLMHTVMAVQQQRPTCQTSSRTGPTTTGPPTRIEVQPGPPTSGILRSQSTQMGASSYTEDAVTNLLAEARGGREAVHVDPLDTREQELLQELGHSARMPIGSTRPHVTLHHHAPSDPQGAGQAQVGSGNRGSPPQDISPPTLHKA